MKKKIKEVKQRIIVWFDGLIIKRFMKVAHNYPIALELVVTITEQIHERSEYRDRIKVMYKNIAEKELVLSTELKPIKKGNDKYHIIVCKDTNLKTVFNLNRHGSKGGITQMKPSYHERNL